MKMDDIMTSTEVVKVFDLNTLATFTLPDTGIADRYNMGHGRIATERYFLMTDVLRVGYHLFKDSDVSLIDFFTRFVVARKKIRVIRHGDHDDWLIAHEASSRLEVSREWIYRLSDFRGGDKIKTIEFGRIRLFWRDDVERLAYERAEA